MPTLVPFTFHWYAGTVPPLVGVAVNITVAPAQIVLPAALEVILTPAFKTGFTVIVIVFDVAGDPDKHGDALEVITTFTAFALVSVLVVNVELFVPTGVAPIYH